MAAKASSHAAPDSAFSMVDGKGGTWQVDKHDQRPRTWPQLQHHDRIVSSLAEEVRGFAKRGESFRINHGSSNSTRPVSTGNMLDISTLNNVLLISKGDLSLDLESWCLVEPNVPMDQLVEATLPYGLVPPVVMEFPGITVGGGFSGTSGESSSFRCGFFSDNVLEVEMILGDGQVVKASHDQHPDLFHGAAGALGTLGVVTALKIRLVPAKTFVHVRYTRLQDNMPDALAQLREMTQPTSSNSFEYLDAILFSPQHSVAITGTLIDESQLPRDAHIQTFSHAADEWFYRHVRQSTGHLSPLPTTPTTAPSSNNNTADDYVPLAEFLFRYDRGGFWVGEAGYDYFGHAIPFTRLTRWLFDDFSHTRTLYHALHATGVTRWLVVQDVAVPWARAAELLEHLDEKLGIWPLWLCPLRGGGRVQTFHPVTASAADEGEGEVEQGAGEMLSVGIWGWGPKERERFVEKNRELEGKLQELGGRKWLYAHMFYTEEEFWGVYDRGWYQGLREKYRATRLASIYDKIKRDTGKQRGWMQSLTEMWPVGGLFGGWRAWRSGDISLHRNANWKWVARG